MIILIFAACVIMLVVYTDTQFAPEPECDATPCECDACRSLRQSSTGTPDV